MRTYFSVGTRPLPPGERVRYTLEERNHIDGTNLTVPEQQAMVGTNLQPLDVIDKLRDDGVLDYYSSSWFLFRVQSIKVAVYSCCFS